MLIDTTFDFRIDAGGKDPDQHSPTLKRYHRLLWSKPLPSGVVFDLDATVPGEYLVHRSTLGEFFLASDAVVPTFAGYLQAEPLIAQIPAADIEEFDTLGYTIGGMMLFPGNRVGPSMTINGARGFHPRIRDRFDLTVECIRRHYRREDSPLAAALDRYQEYFALFEDFDGYVDFFLLHDLVTDDGHVRFFSSFADFATSPIPSDVHAYEQYRQLSMAFLHARNQRVHRWAATHQG